VFLGSKYGLAQGFLEYDEALVHADLHQSHIAVSSPRVTDKGIAFLERQVADGGGQPWFLFLHYFDPHHAYQPHAPPTPSFGDQPVDRYDGEIAFTDAHIGRLLDRLDELSLAEDTVVVFVADHGEEFGDHGGLAHGRTLHREVERIPFAIRVPGLPGRRVEQAASVVDLLPTVLALLRLPDPARPVAGRSLVGAMSGEGVQQVGILLESRLEKRADAELEAYIEGRWKLVVEYPRAPAGAGSVPREAQAVFLYDRLADPTEQHDLSSGHPDIVIGLRARLASAVEAARALAPASVAANALELSAEDLERLQALGYVEGQDPPDAAGGVR
jgi:arylsulfatase A-like enzyme